MAFANLNLNKFLFKNPNLNHSKSYKNPTS
jgi:hypothetical protein